MIKTITLLLSLGAFLALRAIVKAVLLPFRAAWNLRKDPQVST